MYASFAEDARRGLPRIAALFEMVGKIEKEHEAATSLCLRTWKRDWSFPERRYDLAVLQLGHIVIGKKAPEICPVCAHPKAYFQLLAKNY